ncbi:MAG: NADH-quinone oxidoreductase subunit L [Kofleriaceae bacterium]|nr:NADH-quinone oxidoreductase subunit L [Kofleriaceae bacterium]
MDQSQLKLLGLPLLVWIPLLPLLGALINLTIGKRLSKSAVHTIAIGAVALAFAVGLYALLEPLRKMHAAGTSGTGLKQVLYTWIEVGKDVHFKAELAFRLDTLSAVMVMIVTFVGTLIHIYSTGYMHDEPRYAAYFGYLNLFTGSMLILVLAANLPVMFIGWEGVGLCSFLLIGFWFTNESYASAGRKAFVVNRIGDFAFLLGMFLLFWATKDAGFAQSLDFQDLESPAAVSKYVDQFSFAGVNDRLAAVAGVLLFIGAAGKSAQIPLYVWLPDAMAGPTPVSALIHAATMVTAGVYMICRLSVLFASSTTAMIVIATVGTLTALAAAFMAFAQTDLKKVLAYSTVSQLGFMFVAAGTGNWIAAVFHLGTHAFFKAGLFLGAGSVMHGMNGSGDIEQMGGLRKKMPITHATFLVYCLAIAGFPLTAGFFSKDEILAGLWMINPDGWIPHYGKILWVLLSVAALGTAFYMWRLYFLVFSGAPRSDTAEHAHESPRSMTFPLVVLAVLSVAGGWIGWPHLSGVSMPGWFHGLSSWLSPSVTSTYAEGTPILHHLSNGATLGLMGAATTLGLVGILLAYLMYGGGRKPVVDRLTAGPLAGMYVASKNKLWVDEAYEAAIIRPFRALARGTFEIVDRFMIDTVLVNGAGLVVSMFSRLARWVQNGQVQRYMLGLVVGAAVVFFFAGREQKPSFDYRREGGDLILTARPGEGVAGQGAVLSWDINGDGVADADPATGEPLAGLVVRLREGEVGSRVTLFIKRSLEHGKTVSVTRRIRAEVAAAPAPSPGAVGGAPAGGN